MTKRPYMFKAKPLNMQKEHTNVIITQEKDIGTIYTNGAFALKLSTIPRMPEPLETLKSRAEEADEDHYYRNGYLTHPDKTAPIPFKGLWLQEGEQVTLNITREAMLDKNGDIHMRKLTGNGEDPTWIQESILRVLQTLIKPHRLHACIFRQKTTETLAPVTIHHPETKEQLALIMPMQVK